MSDLFITFLYQPFYNLLIAFYIGLEKVPGIVPDMGLAVILLTVVFRILLLPLTIASTRTQAERRDIEKNINEIREKSTTPEIAKLKIRKIFRSNRRVLISETVNFFIQLGLFFILYRIFTTGLEGQDLNLIYDFMPKFHYPFNLNFLGYFDLTHPNIWLNLIQSLVILLVEILQMIDSPFPTSRFDFVRYIIILPIASFLLFMFLPAGKKLFIITTLIFSCIFILTNILVRKFSFLMPPQVEK